MANNANSPHRWRDLLQHLEPLSAHAVFACCEARRISARSRQARDIPAANRISDLHEYDRYGFGLLKQWS